MINEIEIKLKGTRVTQAKVQLNKDKTFACVLLPLDWNKEEVTIVCNPSSIKRLL